MTMLNLLSNNHRGLKGTNLTAISKCTSEIFLLVEFWLEKVEVKTIKDQKKKCGVSHKINYIRRTNNIKIPKYQKK